MTFAKKWRDQTSTYLYFDTMEEVPLTSWKQKVETFLDEIFENYYIGKRCVLQVQTVTCAEWIRRTYENYGVSIFLSDECVKVYFDISLSKSSLTSIAEQ